MLKKKGYSLTEDGPFLFNSLTNRLNSYIENLYHFYFLMTEKDLELFKMDQGKNE